MMIRKKDIHSALLCKKELFKSGNAIVAGDKKLNPLFFRLFNNMPVYPIPVIDTVGNNITEVSLLRKAGNGKIEDGCCTNAVHIIIPYDPNLFFFLYRPFETIEETNAIR